MALHTAPIRRTVPLLPLEGVPAPPQIPPVVWNVKIPYNKIASRFPDFGVNKIQEIKRLFYEISKKEKNTIEKVLNSIRPSNFEAVKKELLKRRFPYSSSAGEEIKPYLPKIDIKPENSFDITGSRFNPEKILVEKSAASTSLKERFRKSFPKAKLLEISSLKTFIRDNKKSGIAS